MNFSPASDIRISEGRLRGRCPSSRDPAASLVSLPGRIVRLNNASRLRHMHAETSPWAFLGKLQEREIQKGVSRFDICHLQSIDPLEKPLTA